MSHIYYRSDNDQVLAVVESVTAAEQEWWGRVHALEEKYGRKAAVHGGFDIALSGFGLIDSDPSHYKKAAFKGTPWVLEPARGFSKSYLRPRSNAEGDAVRADLKSVGKYPDVRDYLPGMPSQTGWLGRCGLFVHDGTVYVEWGSPPAEEVDPDLWEEITGSVHAAAHEALKAEDVAA